MVNLFPWLEFSTGATFSECKIYRYTLWRTWDAELPVVNFLMLNPSTADQWKNDPTVERCERRARDLGYGKLIVTNLFALRSTDPAGLRQVDDPVGPGNDRAILDSALEADAVVCAWGVHGELFGRAAKVLADLRAWPGVGDKLHCLALTKDGSPRHPLYVGYDVQPTPWRLAV